MFRKLLAIVILSAFAAFAQDAEDSYITEVPTSSQTTTSTAAVDNSDPAWTINIHPLSLVVFTALRMPMVYLTIERTITEKTSFVVRPEFLYASSDAYNIKSDTSFTLYAIGAGAGMRYYFNQLHRGMYIDGMLSFAHVGLDYDDKNASASATANGIAPYVFVGWKYLSGGVAFSFDVGCGFNIVSASAEGRASAEDDLESVSLAQNGFGYDVNIMLGFAF